MMELKITEDLRIRRTSDNLQWVVEERKVAGEKAKNPGAETWVTRGYLTKLPAACSFCMENILGKSEVEDVQQLIKKIDEVGRGIVAACLKHEAYWKGQRSRENNNLEFSNFPKLSQELLAARRSSESYPLPKYNQ